MIKPSAVHDKLASPLNRLVSALEAQAPETLPEPVGRAVRLMLSGAAVTAAWGLYLLIVTIANHGQLVSQSGKKLTGGQIAGGIVYNLLVTIILAAAWVLMARMNQRGRSWARITATALFLVWSFETYVTIGAATSSALVVVDVILVALIWLIGAGSLFFLWRPDAAEHFRSGPDA